jgi:hypothetical protein
MSQFIVDPTSLRELDATLSTLRDRLTTMHVSVYADEGTLGYRSLEGELEQFCGRWHWAVSQIGDQIGDLGQRLLAAADAYQRIDDHTMPGATGGGSGGSSTGGTPAPARGSGTGSGTTEIPPTGGSHGGRGSGTTTIGGPRHATPVATGSTITVHSPLLTSDEEVFVARLAMLTGLNPRVIGAWALAEESSGYAEERQAAGNDDWLNIGYFDSGTGAIASNSAFDNPVTAADRTAQFLDGTWGGASSSIRSILSTTGESPDAQMGAIADSDWATSHYDGGKELQGTYDELAGMTVDEG